MTDKDRPSLHTSRTASSAAGRGRRASEQPRQWIAAAKTGGTGAGSSGRRRAAGTTAGATGVGAAASDTTGRAARRRADQRSASAKKGKRPGRKRRPGFWGGVAGALNYPRSRGRGALAWFPSLRMWLAAFALVVLAGLGGAFWLYSTTDVPKPNDVALAQTSTVYFADGKTKMGTFGDVNRTILPADQIPDSMKKALVASEDSTFYENRGVSPKGILRALINNLKGGSRQGASTITQQYVSNYYTSKSYGNYSAKVREMIMAIKIDQELPKDEIISRYLNTIYFGRGAYGVQAAAQAYFGKDAKDLTPAESALLVGIIPGPSLYDPAVNQSKAEQLWKRVVDREVNVTKALTPAQANALKFPKTISAKRKNSLKGPNGYLIRMAESELRRNGFTEESIQTGGFSIVTTIDKAVQDDTVQAIANMPHDRPADNRVGTVTIDPGTGAIKAMYGGPDYVAHPQNDATQSHMQAGSTFKAFALVAALENGYSLHQSWPGDSPGYFPGWKVNNFGNTSYGNIDLVDATTNSVNTAYAALNLDMGAAKTHDAAVQLGVPANTPGLDKDPTNVLGTASPTVLTMAGAYATIAAGGVHHTPHLVAKVLRSDGSVRYESKVDSNRVIPEDVATNATVALQGPPSNGSARYVGQNMDGRAVAGKTGTSESFRSAWFIGFTPQLVTAVGMFQPSADGKTEETLTPFGGYPAMTGGTVPTRVWVDIMKPALDGKPQLDFPSEVSTGRSKRRSSDSSGDGNSGSQGTTPAPTTQAPPTTEAPQPTTQAPAPQPTTQAPAPKPTTQAPQPTTQAPAPKPTKGHGNGKGNGNGNGAVPPTQQPTTAAPQDTGAGTANRAPATIGG